MVRRSDATPIRGFESTAKALVSASSATVDRNRLAPLARRCVPVPTGVRPLAIRVLAVAKASSGHGIALAVGIGPACDLRLPRWHCCCRR
jgi:hypothetical protein